MTISKKKDQPIWPFLKKRPKSTKMYQKINTTKPQKKSDIKKPQKKDLAFKNLKKRATQGRINALYSSLRSSTMLN